MTIRFERLIGFDDASGDSRHLTMKYFLGKEYDSLDDALNQEYKGHDLRWYGFGVAEEKVTPKNLPHIVSEAIIFVRESDGRKIHEIPVVRATYYGPEKEE